MSGVKEVQLFRGLEDQSFLGFNPLLYLSRAFCPRLYALLFFIFSGFLPFCLECKGLESSVWNVNPFSLPSSLFDLCNEYLCPVQFNLM